MLNKSSKKESEYKVNDNGQSRQAAFEKQACGKLVTRIARCGIRPDKKNLPESE